MRKTMGVTMNCFDDFGKARGFYNAILIANRGVTYAS